MARFSHTDLVAFCERCSKDIAGIGLFHADSVTYLAERSSPFAAFCRHNRDTYHKQKCRDFYESHQADKEPGLHRCPFGAMVGLVPCNSLSKEPAMVAVHAAGPGSLNSSLRLATGVSPKCSRRTKRVLKEVLERAVGWTHPAGDPSGTLESIRTQLEVTHTDLEQKAIDRTLSEYSDFVASFSHEALDPLQQIRATLENVSKRLDRTDPQSHSEVRTSMMALDRVRVSLEAMRLLFKEEDVEILDNQLRTVDVRPIVEHWAEIHGAQMRQKNLEFFAYPPRQLWKLRVVKEYFEIIARNLISNAVKYSFDTSKYVDGKPGKVIVRFDAEPNRITFVNYGVPIPADEIETGRLFELAKRGRSSADRGRSGKGVGLFLVKRVAELHDADIVIRSVVQNPQGNEPFAMTEVSVQFPRPPRVPGRRRSTKSRYS